VINRDLVVNRAPEVYYTTPSGSSGTYFCPVGQCIRQADSKWILQRHFYDRHLTDSVSISGEGIYPKCVSCGMQTSQQALATMHRATKMCRVGTGRRVQREAVVSSARAKDVIFTAYNVELDRVDVFKNIG